jgi:hypothetical protein
VLADGKRGNGHVRLQRRDGFVRRRDGRAGKALERLKGAREDQAIGIKIVVRSIEEPLRQIVANVGEDAAVVPATEKKPRASGASLLVRPAGRAFPEVTDLCGLITRILWSRGVSKRRFRKPGPVAPLAGAMDRQASTFRYPEFD